MIWKHRALFVTSVIRSRYQSHDVQLDARRGYNVADTTEVRQIEDYGHAGAHALPPGTGNGFVWRLHSMIRYEERDGGVYLELEAIALSRDIPAAFRGLVKPVVNHISTNSLTATLRQTRDAVKSNAEYRARRVPNQAVGKIAQPSEPPATKASSDNQRIGG